VRRLFICIAVLGIGTLLAPPASAAAIYNNLTPTNAMAIASRPDSAGTFEIEAADDFTLASRTFINSASFVGLLAPGRTGAPTISQVVIEIYRVFPNDSNVGRTSGPPSFSTPQVPTRVNSPSDVAFSSRDSNASQLAFSTSILSSTFTALNSVQAGGIHPLPNVTTGGNGPVTGQEIQFNVSFTTPFDLPADHYFFVPQILVSDGGQFYWLSASRPISGAGTTPFAPDLQAWTRDANLDPDWLRVGTDIVGGATPPTFNAAFSLDGALVATVPEPSTIVLIASALLMLGVSRRKAMR
jgi:hypothetical protein